jgi:UDP-3-O-[3-hydroxymyristoyl] glucosamine N-acyltransferase
MTYLAEEKIKEMGFHSVGHNVQISNKAAIYDAEKISIGDNSRIDDFCIISGSVSIGKYVHITPQCLVAGGILGIEIQDYSTLAYGVKVFTQTDDYTGDSMANSLIPKKYKKEKFEAVNLGRFSIIGTNSVIFPGANIAEGVSIGAMSLVLHPTVEWKIYAGIPARIIRDRSKKLLHYYEQFKIDHDPI